LFFDNRNTLSKRRRIAYLRTSNRSWAIVLSHKAKYALKVPALRGLRQSRDRRPMREVRDATPGVPDHVSFADAAALAKSRRPVRWCGALHLRLLKAAT
jgi:hypothetical protein